MICHVRASQVQRTNYLRQICYHIYMYIYTRVLNRELQNTLIQVCTTDPGLLFIHSHRAPPQSTQPRHGQKSHNNNNNEEGRNSKYSYTNKCSHICRCHSQFHDLIANICGVHIEGLVGDMRMYHTHTHTAVQSLSLTSSIHLVKGCAYDI